MNKRLPMLTAALTACALTLAEPVAAAGDTAGTRSSENTERNVRDRNDATVTPEDQSESESDIRITADIRKAITDDDSLSTNAHNAKVITRNGRVTLRGPVNDEAEKNKLQAIAQRVQGVNQVDNQLETSAP